MISSPPTSGKPFSVAILGRPNVGKSTLFNRLLGRNRAITHHAPGVTRDAVEAEIAILDLRLTLIDTGGYTLADGVIEKQVAARSTAAASSSDLILLLVEASGLNGEDLDLVEKLRPYEQKLIVVVNKVDGEKQAMGLGEFYELGISRVLAVSAAHGRNIEALKDLIHGEARRRLSERVDHSEAGAEQVPSRPPREEKLIRMTILGKPNTGKSTLLNQFLQTEKALVTEIPGTTRDPVEGRFRYKNKTIQVIDTAGIRRKSKVSESVEYYSVNRSIKSIEEADIVVLVIDAGEGVSEQDKKITALAARRGRGIILALNKWDSIAKKTTWAQTRDRTRFLFPTLGFAPLVRISALTGFGIPELMDSVAEVYRQLNRRVATHRLNKLLRSWTSEYSLPVRGKNVKLRYCTQTGVNPVTFLFFVNSIKAYPKRYNQYLMNRIRRDLGFDKIPVFVDLRES